MTVAAAGETAQGPWRRGGGCDRSRKTPPMRRRRSPSTAGRASGGASGAARDPNATEALGTGEGEEERGEKVGSGRQAAATAQPRQPGLAMLPGGGPMITVGGAEEDWSRGRARARAHRSALAEVSGAAQ